MTVKHNEMVAALVKPGAAIIETLTPAKMNLLHMAVGVCGEVAELVDGLCNAKGRENIVEEMGDAEFYLEGLRQELNITRGDVVRALDVHSEDSLKANTLNAPLESLSIFAGDLLDLVKKHVIYNKEMDKDAIVLTMAYFDECMDTLRSIEEISYDECIEANIYKLATGPNARYKAGSYSDKAAQERADKAA